MLTVLVFTLIAGLVLYLFEFKSRACPPHGGEIHLPDRSCAEYVSGSLSRPEFFGQLLPLLLCSVGVPLLFVNSLIGTGLLAGAAALFFLFNRTT